MGRKELNQTNKQNWFIYLFICLFIYLFIYFRASALLAAISARFYTKKY